VLPAVQPYYLHINISDGCTLTIISGAHTSRML